MSHAPASKTENRERNKAIFRGPTFNKDVVLKPNCGRDRKNKRINL